MLNPASAAAATKPIRTAATRPAGLLERLYTRWLERRQMRRDEAWLLRQPDYLLRDIGVERDEIEAIVRRGHFYR